MTSYLFVAPSLQQAGVLQDERIAAFTERHRYRLPAQPALSPVAALDGEIERADISGVIFALSAGLPGRRQLGLVRRALRGHRTVHFYWPAEEAIEAIDRERLASLWRHWIAYQALTRAHRWRVHRRQKRKGLPPPRIEPTRLQGLADPLFLAVTDFQSTERHLAAGFEQLRITATDVKEIDSRLRIVAADVAAQLISSDGTERELLRIAEDFAVRRRVIEDLQIHMNAGETALRRVGSILADLQQSVARVLSEAPDVTDAIRHAEIARALEFYHSRLQSLRSSAGPVPFEATSYSPSHDVRIPGLGLYLRMDYWAQLASGGSYGHTCYVARALADVTEEFLCIMGSRYVLLDEMGVPQEVVRPPLVTATELDLLKADEHYYQMLKARLAGRRPAYIYERMCLGNFVGARLSRELQIPYIVEYNGSEISMRRSFGGGSFEHEELFLSAEDVAFRQATAITVVSEHVRDDLLKRGIDPTKILVNPNGVDCREYAPGTAEERREIRISLDLPEDRPVVGFIGTFGGWHGIDVLAAALPEICRQAPDAKFLLIGDGNLKPMVVEAIRQNGLEDRIADVGRTDQRTGARLLKACDVLVSPHSSHMHDSPFFGSPTKLFEYMAVGGGIVASDLEQIGVVLSPALRPADFADREPTVDDERAVLCRPGDVAEFVDGVVALIRRPQVAEALGRNARQAARDYYSWDQHVANIWLHILRKEIGGYRRDASWQRRSGDRP